MVLDKTGTILDDGSTVARGKFKFVLAENELLNIKQQYLTYNVYMEEADGDKVLTYNHSNFDSDAVIYINATSFPGPVDTQSVTTFSREGVGVDTWYSSTISAKPGINGNEALHTAAVYTASYTGDVVVQATLDNQVTESTQWADVASLTFVGTELFPKPINFNGVFSHLRFKTDANPADKITKILVRN